MLEHKIYKFNNLIFTLIFALVSVTAVAKENKTHCGFKNHVDNNLTQEVQEDEFDIFANIIDEALEIEALEGPKAAFEFIDSHYLRANPDMLLFAGHFAHRAKLVHEAERVLRELLAKDPDHVEAKNSLGYILADANVKLDEAVDLIEEALIAEPDSAHILDSYAWVHYRLGNFELAEHILINEAFPRFEGPIPVESLAHLGVIYWTMGRQDEAIEVWEEAYYQDPEDPYLLETIERYVADTKIY